MVMKPVPARSTVVPLKLIREEACECDNCCAAAQVDPRGPDSGLYGYDRVMRGGCPGIYAIDVRCASSRNWALNASVNGTGFRLARGHTSRPSPGAPANSSEQCEYCGARLRDKCEVDIVDSIAGSGKYNPLEAGKGVWKIDRLEIRERPGAVDDPVGRE